MRDSIILHTDSYKFSHHLQYPPNTTQIYSYMESRGGAEDGLVMFGAQACVKDYLVGDGAFPIVLRHWITEAEELATAHGLPFNREGWEAIHNLGYLPVEIRALPEGTIARSGLPLLTIRNTTPDSYWLPTFLETLLLRGIWYPTTVATISWRIKNIIRKYLEQTGDPSLIDFKLHDFGARGVSSGESAALGGMAHLVNFSGTDNVEAIVAARRFYHEPMAGFSIPAAEHSTITSWGKDNEAAAYLNMIKKFSKPKSMYAMPTDSYDIFNSTENIIGKELKDQIVASGGVFIERPDSGSPPQMVLQCVKMLYKAFGGTLNAKGYIVLHPSVRVIQGDGINERTIEQILSTLQINGFSADNVAFGMGGALLQHMNRDTYQFAMKACATYRDGKWYDVYKDPITSDGTKRSKKGIISTTRDNEGKLQPVRYLRFSDYLTAKDEMHTIFKDGKLLVDETFTTIRGRANGS